MLPRQKMLKTTHQQKTQLSTKTEHLLKKLLAMKEVVTTLVVVSARNSGSDLGFEAVENYTPTDNTTTDKDCTSAESTRYHEGSSHNSFSCSDSENDPAIDSGSDSDFETWKSSSIIQLLPSEYEYKNSVCRRVNTSGSFEAEFKINICSDAKYLFNQQEYSAEERVLQGDHKKLPRVDH